MANDINISFRVDRKLRDDFKAICAEQYGMGSSAAIRLFMASVVRRGKLPVDLLARPADRYAIVELVPEGHVVNGPEE